MRVLVCGGRHYSRRDRVHDYLDQLHARQPITLLVHGAAPGADTLAKEWAAARGVAVDPHPAAWDDLEASGAVIKHRADGRPYNAAAGPTRNAEMLQTGRPGLVVAFPGGDGTADMVSKARAAGVEVIEVPDLPLKR